MTDAERDELLRALEERVRLVVREELARARAPRRATVEPAPEPRAVITEIDAARAREALHAAGLLTAAKAKKGRAR